MVYGNGARAWFAQLLLPYEVRVSVENANVMPSLTTVPLTNRHYLETPVVIVSKSTGNNDLNKSTFFGAAVGIISMSTGKRDLNNSTLFGDACGHHIDVD